MSGRFAVIPIRVLEDERIGMSHLRVLVALGSYCDKNGWARPKSASVASMVKLSPGRVRTCLAELQDFGMVEIHAQFRPDGSQTANHYRVIMDVDAPPIEVIAAAAKTPSEIQTPPLAADTPCLPQEQTPPVCAKGEHPPSALGADTNERTIGTDQVNGPSERPPAPPAAPSPAPAPAPAAPKVEAKNFTAEDLEQLGVDPQHALDWLKVRKRKRADNTPSALKALVREAGAAGITVSAAVQMAAERGWQSFQAIYIAKGAQGGVKSFHEAEQAAKTDRASQFMPSRKVAPAAAVVVPPIQTLVPGADGVLQIGGAA